MNSFSLYLYGSRLRGTHRPQSDVDVLYIGSNSVVPPKEIPNLVFQKLSLPINLNLDLKVCSLSSAKEKLIFPAALVHCESRLFLGPDISARLSPPTVAEFIEFQKGDILLTLGKLQVVDRKSYLEYFSKCQSLKPLYNVIFALSNIDYMIQNQKLNVGSDLLNDSNFKKANNLLRLKLGYKRPETLSAIDQEMYNELVVKTLERIAGLENSQT